MGSESLLPCSQEFSTGPHTNPVSSSFRMLYIVPLPPLDSHVQAPAKPLLIHGPVKQHKILRDPLFCLSHITQPIDIIIVACLNIIGIMSSSDIGADL
jgi:hypothetical protein